MKAVVYFHYGGPEALEVRDLQPGAVKENEVLVQVHAASLNPIDWKILRGDVRLLTGSRMPRRAGCDFAGTIAAVGVTVKRFKFGDAVLGTLNSLSGREGSFAELVCASEDRVVAKPGEMSFPEAAALPIAGVSALDCLRRLGRARAGQHVLIVGAAGGVGTFCVQLARLWGLRVTAVCHSNNAGFVGQLGADAVVAYDRVDPLGGGEAYDLIVDAAAKYSFRRCAHRLTTRGIYVTTMPGLGAVFDAMRTRVFGGRRARVLVAKINRASLEELAQLAAAGKIRAQIGSTFRLEEIRAAYKLSMTGHARGKIIIAI